MDNLEPYDKTMVYIEKIEELVKFSNKYENLAHRLEDAEQRLETLEEQYTDLFELSEQFKYALNAIIGASKELREFD